MEQGLRRLPGQSTCRKFPETLRTVSQAHTAVNEPDCVLHKVEGKGQHEKLPWDPHMSIMQTQACIHPSLATCLCMYVLVHVHACKRWKLGGEGGTWAGGQGGKNIKPSTGLIVVV